MAVIDGFNINGTVYDVQDKAAVHFDEIQALTEEQQARARGNIGAAKIWIDGDMLVIDEDDDFFDQWEWSSTATDLSKLTRLGVSISFETKDGHRYLQVYDTNTSNNRRAFCVLRGVTPLKSEVTGEDSEYYPIPVPYGATKATATLSKPEQYVTITVWKPVGNGLYDKVDRGNYEWKQGSTTVEFDAAEGLVTYISCKYGSSSGGGAYPADSDPDVTLVFE